MSNYIDTRELNERLDELERLEQAVTDAREALDNAEGDEAKDDAQDALDKAEVDFGADEQEELKALRNLRDEATVRRCLLAPQLVGN